MQRSHEAEDGQQQWEICEQTYVVCQTANRAALAIGTVVFTTMVQGGTNASDPAGIQRVPFISAGLFFGAGLILFAWKAGLLGAKNRKASSE